MICSGLSCIISDDGVCFVGNGRPCLFTRSGTGIYGLGMNGARLIGIIYWFFFHVYNLWRRGLFCRPWEFGYLIEVERIEFQCVVLEVFCRGNGAGGESLLET